MLNSTSNSSHFKPVKHEKIKIFLASSNELIIDREAFETKIYRKSKKWFDKGISLHLEIWEDLSARMSNTRSQDEYNKKIREPDLFGRAILKGEILEGKATINLQKLSKGVYFIKANDGSSTITEKFIKK